MYHKYNINIFEMVIFIVRSYSDDDFKGFIILR